MRKPFSLFTLLFIAIGFFSCQKNQSQIPDTFFDSLTISSTRFLVNQKARVKKEVRIGNQYDTVQLQPDSAYWISELDVFKQLASFENPAYRDVYVREDGLKDGTSNLSVRQFKAIKPTSIPVVRFYYYHQFNQLKKIEAEYVERNALYSSSRHLTMEFEEIDSKPVLYSYAVNGFQKMILSDSTLYSIHSTISF